jgi:hypothetical protein
MFRQLALELTHNFSSIVNFHRICRFEGDLAELHHSVKKFAD